MSDRDGFRTDHGPSVGHDLVVVTLASAIIGSRGDKRIGDIVSALEDARFLLYPPDADDAAYENWQRRHGRLQSDPLGTEAARIAAVAEDLRRHLSNLRAEV